MTAAADTQSSALSLSQLLRAGAPSKEIAAYLDGLSASARLAEVIGVTGRGVGKLYDAVADAEPLTLEEFVPASTKGTLIYEGRNSLPAFSRFQKRFMRLSGGEIMGYNHQTMSFVTGPGFFLVRAPSGEGPFGRELLFDYASTPTKDQLAQAPSDWPRYSPNDSGLSNLVYANMYDWVRRVARGVVVGKAYTKEGKSKDAFFSLTLP